MTRLSPAAGAAALLLSLPFASARAQGTAFTYQGRLNSGGAPANGLFDLAFTLFPTNIAGGAIAGPLTNSATTVSNGLFTTTIDFGPGALIGSGNWLEIAVSTNGANHFSTLSPRQPLMPVPYALWAGSASNLSGTVSAAQLTGTLPPAQLPALVVTNGGTGVMLTGNFIGNGAGLTNVSSPGMAWQAVTGAVQAQSNQGYIASDTAMVTITLPAAPNVGDLVRVSGAGTGGWTIAQNAGQVILGASFSAVAPNAVKHASSLPWTSVASSADGTNLVASEASTLGRIWTSSDAGATWTALGTTGSWKAVASSADGTKLAAASDSGSSYGGGHIYTSSDSGVTWTVSNTNFLPWTSLASSADGTKLVATALGYTLDQTGFSNGFPIITNVIIVPPGCYRSSDAGATWKLDSGQVGTAVASSADGTTLVGLGNGTTYLALHTSTNSGVAWTARLSTTESNWTSAAVSADGTKVVATQSPGQVWTSSESGKSLTAHDAVRNWKAVASSADGSTLAAATSNGQIYMSWNSGITWVPHLPNPLTSMPGPGGLALSADGSRLVAVDNPGFIWTFSENTTSGTSGSLVGGRDAAVELQYIGNNQFRPLSFTGGIYCH